MRTNTGTSSIATLAVGSERNGYTGVGGLEAICFSSHSLGVLSEVTSGFLAWLWHLGHWGAGGLGVSGAFCP